MGLEFDRMNRGSYQLDVNDILWTTRDILWTFIMIFFFQHMKKIFVFDGTPSTNSKIKTKIISKKR
ncbi:TPA: hypothetical protein DCZ39_05095 [Patescibacteria group bacterium]|nr:hypothetical protein [Candidatus Gracilibacteria bacterium]